MKPLRFLFALSLTAAAAAAQSVVINEFSAAHSDRVLQFPAGSPPRLGPLGQRWCDPGPLPACFVSMGPGPFGFGVGGEWTNLSTRMLGITPGLYLRTEITLTAAQAALTDPLELVASYADGLLVYINGVEVARRNLGPVGSFVFHDQPAFNLHDAGAAETIILGAVNALLHEGVNTIALQCQNNALAEGANDPPQTAQGGGRFRCDTTLRIGGAAPQALIAPNAVWHYMVGVHEPSGGLLDAADIIGPQIPGPDWTQVDYAPASAWTEAPGALGYDSNTTTGDFYRASNVAGSQCSTSLGAMYNSRMSVYMRRTFDLTQAQIDGISALNLTVDWDDGYVLFLNGHEISRANLPGAPGTLVAFNTAATVHNASTDNGRFGNPLPGVAAAIPLVKNHLRVGANVIAAQLHNAGTGSSDLMLDVQFSASGSQPLTFATKNSLWRYFIPTAEFAVMPPPGILQGPQFFDWIELRNTTSAPVNIGGWALTDDNNAPAKWTFPAGAVIPADGYLVVACSGRDRKPASGLLHTNFDLKDEGESVRLRDASGLLVHEATQVPEQNFHHTWGLDGTSGQWRYFDTATPGAANSGSVFSAKADQPAADKETGFYDSPVLVTLGAAAPGAQIRYTLDGSEPTPSSPLYTGPVAAQPPPLSNGPGAGWILREVWNSPANTFVPPASLPVGTAPSGVGGLATFESPSHVADWYGQRVSGHVQVTQSGDYTFYLATDDGGELWLSPNDQVASRVRIAYIQGNWAAPREWTKFPSQRSAPQNLVAGQRYYIEARQAEGSGGDNLAVGWTGPGYPSITVIPGSLLSPPDGTSFVFTQASGSTLRARTFAPGMLPSAILTRNYALNFSAGVRSLPAIFLTGQNERTFYKPNGIFSTVGGSWPGNDWVPTNTTTDYNFCLQSGRTVERPAVLEMVRTDNSVQLRTELGVRFAGSPWSRPKYRLEDIENADWNASWLTKPQMNLFFRGELGMDRLRSDGFIPGSHVHEWDTLRLRAGKNDAYNPFIIDEWMRRTFRFMGNHPSPIGFFATVFLNGKLKGYFNPTERPRDSFFREFYDSENEWDVNVTGEWESGDSTAFNTMRAFFRGNDFSVLANYQTGAALWDPVNAADYYIANAWGATQDWPHNNYAFCRERAAGKLWRFSMWDAEGALGMFGQANTHDSFTTDLLNTSPATETLMGKLCIQRFIQSPEWRLLFADRIQRHFFNNGVMTAANTQARWNSLRDQVKDAVSAIHGSGYYEGHWTNWLSRTPTFLNQCRAQGLWPVTAAPGIAPFGGTVVVGGTVTLTNPNGVGTLYLTTDGTDPRAVGGAVGAAASIYSTPLSVTQPVTIKARVLNGGEWSPLAEADFAPPPPRVLITEINFNPPGPDDLTEFVELMNVGGSSASLNGASFTSGIVFTFPDLTLAPGQRTVVVKDAAAFAAAYSGVIPAGVFAGGLKNSADTLTLVDLVGNLITAVTYGDSAPWTPLADGDGGSLVLMRPQSVVNHGDAANWRASTASGGNPGGTDAISFAGNSSADSDSDGWPALIEHALGSSDSDPHSVPFFMATADADGTIAITTERHTGVEDVILEAVTSSDITTWTPVPLTSDTPALNGRATLLWHAPAAALPRLFIKLRAHLVP